MSNRAGKIERLEASISELAKAIEQAGGDPALEEELHKAYEGLVKAQTRKLSQLNEIQAKSEHEIEARKERLAVTVHDLKVPITVSLLNLELAGMEPEQMEKQNYLIAVRRELEFLLDTISNLLDLEQEKAIKITRQEVNLRELLDGIIERMSVIITDKPELELQNNIPATLPPIQADRHKLVRVFCNLISNAIKYTDMGHISISADYDHKTSSVSIDVQDTGQGIEPDRLPELFRLFEGDQQRMDSSGVGLAFVKLAIEAHGGGVSISSKKGEGTVVKLVVPVVGE